MRRLEVFWQPLVQGFAFTLMFLTYPLFVLPRALWSAHKARQRLRTYGPPMMLEGLARRGR